MLFNEITSLIWFSSCWNSSTLQILSKQKKKRQSKQKQYGTHGRSHHVFKWRVFPPFQLSTEVVPKKLDSDNFPRCRRRRHCVNYPTSLPPPPPPPSWKTDEKSAQNENKLSSLTFIDGWGNIGVELPQKPPAISAGDEAQFENRSVLGLLIY